jgi:hypothetical protein
MGVLAIRIPSERGSLLGAVILLGLIGITLLALAPRKQTAEKASAASA